MDFDFGLSHLYIQFIFFMKTSKTVNSKSKMLTFDGCFDIGDFYVKTWLAHFLQCNVSDIDSIVKILWALGLRDEGTGRRATGMFDHHVHRRECIEHDEVTLLTCQQGLSCVIGQEGESGICAVDCRNTFVVHFCPLTTGKIQQELLIHLLPLLVNFRYSFRISKFMGSSLTHQTSSVACTGLTLEATI